jgi:DNA-binding CsgD family transcriptional regulator
LSNSALNEEMLGRYSNCTPPLLPVLSGEDTRGTAGPAADPPKARRRPLLAEEIAHLLTAYAAGASTYELASELALDRQAVANYIRRNGGRLRTRRRAELGPIARREALSLATDGLSVRAIARRLQAGYRAVQRAVEHLPEAQSHAVKPVGIP